MKRYAMEKESIVKMMNKFSDAQEFNDFHMDLDLVGTEIFYNYMTKQRTPDEDEMFLVLSKSMFVIALFFRDNMELMMDLVRELDCKEVKDDDKEYEPTENNYPL